MMTVMIMVIITNVTFMIMMPRCTISRSLEILVIFQSLQIIIEQFGLLGESFSLRRVDLHDTFCHWQYLNLRDFKIIEQKPMTKMKMMKTMMIAKMKPAAISSISPHRDIKIRGDLAWKNQDNSHWKNQDNSQPRMEGYRL